MANAGNRFDGAYEKFPEAPGKYREDQVDATLAEIFRTAVAHANSRIEWYGRSASVKATVAKRLRRWSLILFAVGTIAPISIALLVQFAHRFGRGPEAMNTFDYLAGLPMAEIGYVLLAVAGALVIFDQFFDSSGSWIRFRQSEARLQVLLAEFRFAWAGLLARGGGSTGEPAQVGALTKLAHDFVTRVEILAEEETAAWAQRFTERLSSFDRNPSLKVSLNGDQPQANGSAGHPPPARPGNGQGESGRPGSRDLAASG